jgi:hypothetical protein
VVKSTTTIDLMRLALGGISAGVVISAVTGIANATLLSREFAAWASQLGNNLHPPDPVVQLCLWTVRSLLDGVAGVSLYANSRSHLGGGLKVALWAGLFVWTIGRVGVALDLVALGIFPLRIVVEQSALGMIAIVSGVLIGARIYGV